MTYSKQWARYLTLLEERPESFLNNGGLTIVTDWAIVHAYEQRTGTTIGVCYESPYRLMVVDLVYEKEGEYFTYERLLPAVTPGAVVCVPQRGEQLILLRQYRHALRDVQYAFPRGFAEPGLSGEDNARKELWEELGCRPGSVTHLGTVIADSGLSGEKVDVYLCQVDTYEQQSGHEGILDSRSLSLPQLHRMIANGEITDGYTLAAMSYLLSLSHTPWSSPLKNEGTP